MQRVMGHFTVLQCCLMWGQAGNNSVKKGLFFHISFFDTAFFSLYRAPNHPQCYFQSCSQGGGKSQSGFLACQLFIKGAQSRAPSKPHQMWDLCGNFHLHPVKMFPARHGNHHLKRPYFKDWVQWLKCCFSSSSFSQDSSTLCASSWWQQQIL